MLSLKDSSKGGKINPPTPSTSSNPVLQPQYSQDKYLPRCLRESIIPNIFLPAIKRYAFVLPVQFMGFRAKFFERRLWFWIGIQAFNFIIVIFLRFTWNMSTITVLQILGSSLIALSLTISQIFERGVNGSIYLSLYFSILKVVSRKLGFWMLYIPKILFIE